MPRAGRLTAVEVRCRANRHVMLSLHPVGRSEFLVWRRPGRLPGPGRDLDEFRRHGAATPGLDEDGFGRLDETAHIIDGRLAGDKNVLLGGARVIACRCTAAHVGTELADAIEEALSEWWFESNTGKVARTRGLTAALE